MWWYNKLWKSLDGMVYIAKFKLKGICETLLRKAFVHHPDSFSSVTPLLSRRWIRFFQRWFYIILKRATEDTLSLENCLHNDFLTDKDPLKFVVFLKFRSERWVPRVRIVSIDDFSIIVRYGSIWQILCRTKYRLMPVLKQIELDERKRAFNDLEGNIIRTTRH